MITFDFIVGDEFRAGLESDHRDLVACAEASAWKPVLVLAGIIIEALLIDHLVASDFQTRSGKDPLKLSLADAITECKKDGLLSGTAADLCSAVRSYRNLIHPGRALRVAERADESTARIAESLVALIANDLAKLRRRTYGWTAEQIVSKVERDSSATAILGHLFSETREAEVERLILKILPERYMELDDAELSLDEWTTRNKVLMRFRGCYRRAFEGTTEAIKRRAVARYVQILKEADDRHVVTYDAAFFRAKDLAFTNENNQRLVREHVLQRLQDGVTDDTLPLANGLEQYLDNDTVSGWIDAFVRTLVFRSPSGQLKQHITTFLQTAASALSKELDEQVRRRLQDWIDLFQRQSKPEPRGVVVELRGEMFFDELPF
jgi:hypothetical protein